MTVLLFYTISDWFHPTSDKPKIVIIERESREFQNINGLFIPNEDQDTRLKAQTDNSLLIISTQINQMTKNLNLVAY